MAPLILVVVKGEVLALPSEVLAFIKVASATDFDLRDERHTGSGL
jgi:hypothetical protein